MEITPEDVDRRYHGDLFATFTREEVQDQIDDAIAWIEAAHSCVKRRLASGLLPERAYMRIVIDMVLRVLRNPEGIKDENDGTYSYGLQATVASGNFWLTKDEKAILCGSTSSGVGSVGIALDRGWGR